MTTTTVTPALPEVPAAGTVYAHSTTGWTFTTDGHRGPFGASLSGVWQNGTAGVIFPTETFRDGAPVWSIR